MPLRSVDLEDGRPQERREVYDEWVVVSQDCDLAWKAVVGSRDFLVELRPAISDPDISDWGIRNPKFRLDDAGHCLDNNLPRLHVSPAVVNAGLHVSCLDADSVLRLKTWLGLRYDRPAVPQRYVKLAKTIADKIKTKKTRALAGLNRDVLVRFRDSDDGQILYELVAVLSDENATAATRQQVEIWLGEVALAVSPDLGIAAQFDVVADSEVSLAYIESSFSLDLSTVSWPYKIPGPKGQI